MVHKDTTCIETRIRFDDCWEDDNGNLVLPIPRIEVPYNPDFVRQLREILDDSEHETEGILYAIRKRQILLSLERCIVG